MFESLLNLTAYFAAREITGARIRGRHTVIGMNVYVGIPAVQGSQHSSQIRPATSISSVRRSDRPLCQGTIYSASAWSAHEERNTHRATYAHGSTVNMGGENILDISHIHFVVELRSITVQLECGNASRVRIACWNFFAST
jgi:hypothetical protein